MKMSKDEAKLIAKKKRIENRKELQLPGRKKKGSSNKGSIQK
jgi:hypothetical protein